MFQCFINEDLYLFCCTIAHTGLLFWSELAQTNLNSGPGFGKYNLLYYTFLILLLQDGDMAFSFSGCFQTTSQNKDNYFIFPDYRVKITFPHCYEDVNLFAFNPRIQVMKNKSSR